MDKPRSMISTGRESTPEERANALAKERPLCAVKKGERKTDFDLWVPKPEYVVLVRATKELGYPHTDTWQKMRPEHLSSYVRLHPWEVVYVLHVAGKGEYEPKQYVVPICVMNKFCEVKNVAIAKKYKEFRERCEKRDSDIAPKAESSPDDQEEERRPTVRVQYQSTSSSWEESVDGEDEKRGQEEPSVREMIKQTPFGTMTEFSVDRRLTVDEQRVKLLLSSERSSAFFHHKDTGFVNEYTTTKLPPKQCQQKSEIVKRLGVGYFKRIHGAVPATDPIDAHADVKK
jgi:hypothetical protein